MGYKKIPVEIEENGAAFGFSKKLANVECQRLHYKLKREQTGRLYAIRTQKAIIKCGEGIKQEQ